MFRLISIILSILLFILSCCTGRYDSRLLSAQRDMDEHPDSVLAMLSAIDTTRLSSRDRALCNLLCTQALDKTDAIAVNPDLSRISSALRYFDRHGSDREKMLSNFYRARYFFYDAEYEDAMHYAFLAFCLSEKVGEPYWIAKTAEFVADINSATFLSDEFLKYEKIAVDNYRLDNSRGNYEYALCDYAYEKIYRGELEEGISICDSVFKVAVASGNHFLAINAAENLLDGYHRENNPENGLRILKYLESRPEYIPSSYNLSLAAGLYRMNCQLDSSRLYLDSAKSTLHSDREHTTFFTESKELLLDKGDTVGALAMTDSLLGRQNAYLKNILQHPPVRAQKDYFLEEAARQGKMVVSRNLTIFILAILFLLIIAISVLYFRQREEAMNLEREGFLRDIAGLTTSVVDLHQEMVTSKQEIAVMNKEIVTRNQDIAARDKEIVSMNQQIDCLNRNLCELTLDIKRADEEKERSVGLMKSQIKELEEIFYSQFKTISLLANEYYDRGGIEKARGEIMKQIEREINLWKSHEKCQEIENALNLYSDNVVKRLRAQCPKLTEKNISFILYLWIGLPPKAIALFCSLRVGSFYANRQRIIEKIQKSEAEDKEEFICRCLNSY